MLEPSQSPPPTKAAQRDASRLPHGDENLTPLAQLRRMQRVLFSDVVDPETDKRLRPQAACAWDRLELRKSVLTMKPAPKPIDVTPKQSRKRSFSGSAPIVPTDAGQAPAQPGQPGSGTAGAPLTPGTSTP